MTDTEESSEQPCPIFKDICFRDLNDHPDRIEYGPDRCPCGWFVLDVNRGEK